MHYDTNCAKDMIIICGYCNKLILQVVGTGQSKEKANLTKWLIVMDHHCMITRDFIKKI